MLPTLGLNLKTLLQAIVNGENYIIGKIIYIKFDHTTVFSISRSYISQKCEQLTKYFYIENVLKNHPLTFLYERKKDCEEK